MNKAEELCHSSGAWKKHKYIQKIGEGANAVYKYAKKGAEAVGDASGVSLKKEIEKNKDWAKMDHYNASEGYIDEDRKRYYTEQGKGERRTAYELQKKYNKTPLGKAESAANKTKQTVKSVSSEAVSRGQSLINKLFGKGTEKVTITDMKTGKTRTPSKPKSEADTINIKELAKKNGKFKKK